MGWKQLKINILYKKSSKAQLPSKRAMIFYEAPSFAFVYFALTYTLKGCVNLCANLPFLIIMKTWNMKTNQTCNFEKAVWNEFFRFQSFNFSFTKRYGLFQFTLKYSSCVCVTCPNNWEPEAVGVSGLGCSWVSNLIHWKTQVLWDF